jgi:hypothetical protein
MNGMGSPTTEEPGPSPIEERWRYAQVCPSSRAQSMDRLFEVKLAQLPQLEIDDFPSVNGLFSVMTWVLDHEHMVRSGEINPLWMAPSR